MFEGGFIQMAKMKFNPEGSQFDPRHPPLEKTFIPRSRPHRNERKIYDPLVDGYGPRLKL